MNTELIKEHPFIDHTRASGFSFIMFDKELLSSKMKRAGVGPDEALVYAVLKDRLSLSIKNEWKNEDGHYYVLMSKNNACKEFGWAKQKTINVFRNLAAAGLIREEECENNKQHSANRIYLRLWNLPGSFNIDKENIAASRLPEVTRQILDNELASNYFILPKILLTDERFEGLSVKGMLLFMMILDKLSLSERYGRVDSNGLVWTTLRSADVEESLGCSKNTVTTLYKELEQGEMIRRLTDRETGKIRIYARDYMPLPDDATAEPYTANDEGCGSYPKIHTTASQNSYHPVPINHTTPSQNSYPNNPPNNLLETKIHQTASEPAALMQGCISFSSGEDWRIVNKRARDICHFQTVEGFITSFSKNTDDALEFLADCLQIIEKSMTSSVQYISIGNTAFKKEVVFERYKLLSAPIVYILIEHLVDQKDKIKNRESYIQTALFNAPIQHKGRAYYFCQDNNIPLDA